VISVLIENISFSYDKKIDRLKAISSTIEQGKITTIIGPNGCGKSTLLSIMFRNNAAREGQITLDEKDILDYKPREFAKKLAMVHQQNEAPSDMTVEKLITFGRLPYKTIFSGNAKEDEEAIEWAMACTKLQEKRHKKISDLSGGERQRVWIAMSLAQKTPILFLDEPTTYLDIYYQIEILELVNHLNKTYGLTIVMVLHDINQAIRYSDNMIVMKEGEIVLQGNPTEIISEDTIKEIYGVEVVLKSDSVSGLYLIPIGI